MNPELHEYEVEVTWMKRVKVQARSLAEAEMYAPERAADLIYQGEAPDSEEVEVVNGPEDE